MDLSHEEVQQILKIIDASSCEELHLELGEFKLIVKKKGGTGQQTVRVEVERGASGAEVPAVWPEGGAEPAVMGGVKEPAPTESGQAGSERRARAGGVELKAPMVGTFYRAPAPGAQPFVEVGSLVKEEDTVCIIEVMKLMNSIRAGCRGRVVEIYPDDGSLVEFGQTLMVIEPVL